MIKLKCIKSRSSYLGPIIEKDKWYKISQIKYGEWEIIKDNKRWRKMNGIILTQIGRIMGQPKGRILADRLHKWERWMNKNNKVKVKLKYIEIKSDDLICPSNHYYIGNITDYCDVEEGNYHFTNTIFKLKDYFNTPKFDRNRKISKLLKINES